jgi:transposase
MPGPSATRIRVTPTVRKQLLKLSRSTTAAHRLVERSQIVLLAASGVSNARISGLMNCSEKMVRKWRQRFHADPTKRGLNDAHRSGRPARVSVAARCELVKLACDRPDDNRAAFRDVWTLATLRDALEARSGVRLSVSEVGRILRSEGLRPHRLKMWLHSPDPQFREKVERICALYLRVPRGAHVLCVDEKTGMQALGRKHPTKRPRPGAPGRFEFEYVRNGTQALIAAFDVRTGQVFGHCRDRRTADDLDAFMEALAKQYPSGDVYLVWDNLNTHCGDKWLEFSRRHGGRFHFVYTPKHASWVNQIEIWFGILHRRLLKHGEFDSVAELRSRVEGFIDHWNRHEAHPFRWTFRGTFAHADAVAA